MNTKYNFEKELNTITTSDLKIFAKWCLNILPDYFYHVPASSTGKYHPNYALGEGGLVRHTMACVRIANELFRNNTVQNFTEEEKDIIRVSLLIHDGVKRGVDGSRYTTTTHPLEVVKWIEDKFEKTELESLPQEVITIMSNYNWDIIKNCVSSHMGEWNKDYRTKREVLPKPKQKIERFVHLCDYLASRKILEVNFDVEG